MWPSWLSPGAWRDGLSLPSESGRCAQWYVSGGDTGHFLVVALRTWASLALLTLFLGDLQCPSVPGQSSAGKMTLTQGSAPGQPRCCELPRLGVVFSAA